ncbi:hypothetical protein PIB30_007260 [Stylosanthes scabra]|uniref:PB1-like domain-containing protein n=1 Tax=Stylosanthes scabra TaxID=79078 RepID=A0ABU6W5P3_9FABA|nr:hypothetical protein [Stylosanthes scabra]
MNKFATIPVLKVGGRLGTNENGVLKYIDGVQQSFAALDVEFLNIFDLEAMAKTLGYPSYTAMQWLDSTAANLEFGPRRIKKDCDINELRTILNFDGKDTIPSAAIASIPLRPEWSSEVRYMKNKKGLPHGTMGWPLFGETTEFLKQGPNFMKNKRAR